MEKSSKQEGYPNIAVLLGLMVLLTFWLTIATFPDFFFFNPLENTDTVRRVSLVLSSIGWIFTSTLLPLVLFIYSLGGTRLVKFIPPLALAWPISLIIAQFTTFTQSGSFYFQYLIDFPIFIFTDLAIPLITMIVWFDLKKSLRSTLTFDDITI
jgi:hypothetical protein